MVCEVLGAVECLFICVIDMAADVAGPNAAVVSLWAAGVAGMTLAVRQRTR